MTFASRVRVLVITLPGYFWDRWQSLAGKLSWDVTNTQVNSALHSSTVAKSTTSFGWGKGANVTAARWQITLRNVISRNSVVISITNCYSRFTCYTTHNKIYTCILKVQCLHGQVPGCVSAWAGGIGQWRASSAVTCLIHTVTQYALWNSRWITKLQWINRVMCCDHEEPSHVLVVWVNMSEIVETGGSKLALMCYGGYINSGLEN